MKLTARYFAAFREATGVDCDTFETNASTPAELFDACRERHPGLQQYQASMVAVNDEMSHWNTRLAQGDVVLFFPPVAGG